MYIDIDRHHDLANQYVLKDAAGRQIMYAVAADDIEGWYIQTEVPSLRRVLHFAPIQWHRIEWASEATGGATETTTPALSLIGRWARIVDDHHHRYDELKDFLLLVEAQTTPGQYGLSVPGPGNRRIRDPVILDESGFRVTDDARDFGPFPTQAYTERPPW